MSAMETNETQEQQSREHRKSTRAAGVVGVAVMCSRVLGLVREQLMGHCFGAGRLMDVFTVAFRIPNLLRDLFAEGALSTAFVTVFSKQVQKEGDASAWALANKVATLAIVVLSAVVLAGIVAAPWLVNFLAEGFVGEKAALTIQLTQIMFPFILLVSLAALVMGLLNAKDVFGAPAMASSFFNLGSIAGGIGLAWYLDPGFGPKALVGLSIGTLVGGGAQLVSQFPALRRVGYRFRPDFLWKDEGVRQVLRLMGPAVIAASAVQVNVMVNQSLASKIPGDGAVSSLNYAFRLIQLPIGVFGVALGTVTLPLVARYAAGGDWKAFGGALGRGIRMGVLLTVPSTLGLVCLAEPIISVVYERGKFDHEAVLRTAAAIRFYAIGLSAYAGIKVLAPAFYAMDCRRTPMLVSFAAMGGNYVLSWVFTVWLGMGHRGLALSTGCVALANFVALYGLMRRRLGGLETGKLLGVLGKLAVAGALRVGVCEWGGEWIQAAGAQAGFWGRLVRLLAVIGGAAGVFFAAAHGLGIEEMRDLVGVARRRLGRLGTR
ncbi:MAG: hypothetical protein RLZZ142_2163 [Verrucomicrobiota bacterium]